MWDSLGTQVCFCVLCSVWLLTFIPSSWRCLSGSRGIVDVTIRVSPVHFGSRIMSSVRTLAFLLLFSRWACFTSRLGLYYFWDTQQLFIFLPDLRCHCLWSHFILTDWNCDIYTNIFMSSYFWGKDRLKTSNAQFYIAPFQEQQTGTS